MAFLFVDSLVGNNSRFVQISGKILELVLLSVGLLSTLVLMKESSVLPYSCKLVFSSLVGFWSSITCLLSSSPAIIIMINLMVLLILASSTFYTREPPDDHQHGITTLLDVHDHDHDHDHDQQTTLLDVHDHDHLQIADHESPIVSPPPPSRDVVEVSPPPPPPPPPPQVEKTSSKNNTTSTIALLQGMRSHDVSPQNQLSFNKALVPKVHEIDKATSSSQSTQVNTETKALPPPPSPLEKWKDVFIENDEEEGTMEATWKAITGGGKQQTKKKHLKKSGTWNVPPPPPPPPRRYVAVQRLDSEEVLPTSPKWKELRKAETFNDAVSLIRRGGLIRRDPSMSLEEFNQKVEAFIKKSKSNDNMRLQRQESHQRFLDVINQKVFN